MRVLVFQHVAGEPPAAFSHHIAAAGDSAHIVKLFQGDSIPDLSQFDLLLVMGGPMDVWEEQAHPWLADEKRAISDWVTQDRGPYLGICLGHQLLAEAMGGICAKMSTPEIAVSHVALTDVGRADPLLGTLGHPFPAVHWHGVEVSELPEGSEILARSADCENQAFRIGPRAWGFQFHPEIEPGTLTTWMQDPGNQSAAAAWLGSAEAAQDFVNDSEENADQFVETSAAIYTQLRSFV